MEMTNILGDKNMKHRPTNLNNKLRTKLDRKESTHNTAGCSSCIQLNFQNSELREALSRINQFEIASKMKKSANDKNLMANDKVLDFECFCFVDELFEYVESLAKSNSNRAWFSGKIDLHTDKIISFSCGRIKYH